MHWMHLMLMTASQSRPLSNRHRIPVTRLASSPFMRVGTSVQARSTCLWITMQPDCSSTSAAVIKLFQLLTMVCDIAINVIQHAYPLLYLQGTRSTTCKLNAFPLSRLLQSHFASSCDAQTALGLQAMRQAAQHSLRKRASIVGINPFENNDMIVNHINVRMTLI